MFVGHRMALRLLTVTTLAVAVAIGSPGGASAAQNPVVGISQPSDPLAPSQSFTSSITVTNTGNTDAAPFTFVITLPRLSSGTPRPTRTVTLKNGVTCTSYTPRYGSSRLTCTVAALAAGASIVTAKIKFVPPSPTPFPYAGVTTSVGVSGPTNSVSAVYKWRAAGPPNLIPSTPSLSPGTALAGTGPITLYGTITDAGYGTAGPFNWRVNLPAGATNLAQPAAIAGTTCVSTANRFDCSTTGLTNGGSFSFTFTFNAPSQPGSYSSTVTLDTANAVAEGNESDNVATSGSITVPGTAANLTISATNPASAGQYSVFTRSVTVTNIGGSPATNVSFMDSATPGPFDVFSLSAVPAGVTCSRYVTYSGRPSTAHYHGVRCNVGDLAAGSSLVVPYDLVVKNNAAGTYTSSLSASTPSYTDPASTPAGTTSIAVFAPAPPNPPLLLALPGLSGDTNTGSLMTTTPGSWIGAGTINYEFRWQRCNASGNSCGDISGETSASYNVSPLDVGATLRAVVTAANSGGSTTAASVASAVVVGAVAPTIATPPALIPGLEKQPTFLWSVNAGAWNGTPTITFTYQWLRCKIGGGACVDIDGATSSSYVLQDADVFHSVQVRVTATNSGGTGVTYSNVSPEIDPFG